jgi:hypothetical protein
LHGIATDDSHMPLFDIGQAWTWVKVEERTSEAVVSALRDGHAYGSTGQCCSGGAATGPARCLHGVGLCENG